jgi:hypothetical protein
MDFLNVLTGYVLTSTALWSDRLLPDGDEMDLKGAVFCEGALIINDSGSLDVNANTKHAIASDGHVRLREGVLTLDKGAASHALNNGLLVALNLPIMVPG